MEKFKYRKSVYKKLMFSRTQLSVILVINIVLEKLIQNFRIKLLTSISFQENNIKNPSKRIQTLSNKFSKFLHGNSKL